MIGNDSECSLLISVQSEEVYNFVNQLLSCCGLGFVVMSQVGLINNLDIVLIGICVVTRLLSYRLGSRYIFIALGQNLISFLLNCSFPLRTWLLNIWHN